jgi:hypothetical protein
LLTGASSPDASKEDQRQASRKPTTSHALPQRVPYRESRHDLPRGPRQQNGSMSCHPCPQAHCSERKSLCERRRPLARVGFCPGVCLPSPPHVSKDEQRRGWDRGGGSEQERAPEENVSTGVADGSGERPRDPCCGGRAKPPRRPVNSESCG